MMMRTFRAALLAACSAFLLLSVHATPAPATAAPIQPRAHGPSLVAYCSVCAGLQSSTGNLYFTDFGVNEFGPSFAAFYRTGKFSLPGSEGLLYRELGPAYFNFGNVVWALVGGTYYGYFVANYDRFGVRYSQIKRVPLAGGSAVILAQTSAYIGVGDLATDGTSLFWADAGGIRTMSVAGGAVRTLVASTSVSHIGLDPGNVYYSEGVRISRVPKTGGAPLALFVAAANVTALFPWSASPSYTVVFWGEQGGAVRSNSVFGNNRFTWQNPFAGRDITSVGYDGARALWIDCAEPGNTQCTARIQSGGIYPTTVNAGVGAGHLQWDATSMYWIGVPGIQRYVY